MSHQERLELLNALVRASVKHYKSHDLEIQFGNVGEAAATPAPEIGAQARSLGASQPSPVDKVHNEAATQKAKELIETLKLDDESLINRIFPAGAGG